MLSLYGFGVLLWLAYGLFIDAQAVALTNGAAAILIAAATVLKAWKERRGLSRSVAPNRCANSAKPRSPEPPFEKLTAAAPNGLGTRARFLVSPRHLLGLQFQMLKYAVEAILVRRSLCARNRRGNPPPLGVAVALWFQ